MGQLKEGAIQAVVAWVDFTNTDTVATEDADKVDGYGWNWHIDNSGTIVGQDAALNGVARFTTGTANTDQVEIVTGTVYRADAGPLVMEARVAPAVDLTDKSLFIGFKDNAALETPFAITCGTDTVTSTATDGVGFLSSSQATTKNWFLVGVDSDTDATAQIVPTLCCGLLATDTFQTLRVEVTEDACNSSVATFYLNGNQVGDPMQSAMSSNVAIAATALVTSFCGATLMDVDYALATGSRANTCAL